jgi:hypothetical protein
VIHAFPSSQGLTQLEQLVDKVLDLLQTRIEGNLRAVAGARLLDLPPGRTFAHEDFAAHQASVVRRHADQLVIRRACVLQHVTGKGGVIYSREFKKMDENPIFTNRVLAVLRLNYREWHGTIPGGTDVADQHLHPFTRNSWFTPP